MKNSRFPRVLRTTLSLCAMTAFLAPSLALADVAPDISTIGTIGPVQENRVQMTKEVVRFSFPNKELKSRDTVPAVATFWMHNPTKEKITVSAIFPTEFSENATGDKKPYAKNIRVSVNGRPAPSKLKDGTYPVKDDAGKMSDKKTSGYAFSFSVPAKRTVTVTIRFDAPLGASYWDGTDLTLDYLLASGAGWGGTIGRADFQFVYPFKLKKGWIDLIESRDPKSLKGLALESVNERTKTWRFKNFEPNDAQVLKFTFMPPLKAKKTPTAEILHDRGPNYNP